MLVSEKRATICAITTPMGIGAIAGIRIAGKNTLSVLEKITHVKPDVGKIMHGFVYDDNRMVDEVMFFFRRAPNTYTGCDEAEIFCHGGFTVPEMLIELLVGKGCKMAAPGEFTQRAFLNGKIDLVQAESIMDIVNAKTKDAAVSAISILKGDFSDIIAKLRKQLVYISSLIEANLDFPEEEDINFDKENTLNIISDTKKIITDLIRENENNIMMKRGISVTITGKPNVGKSSLFNLLLSREKAIVTGIPGTTRDVLEGWININGFPVLIKDTAGIRLTDDPVEKIGIKRTKKEIEKANIILALFDASRDFDENDRLHLEFLKNAKHVFYILTKVDLEKRLEETEIPYISGGINCRDSSFGSVVNRLIVKFISHEKISLNLNDRITKRLKNAREYINKTEKVINYNEGLELAAEEIKEAISNLSAITGKITTNEVLNNIFSSFCIGK